MNSSSNAKKQKPPFAVALWRAIRLRCPRCGQDRLFRGWFRMNDECSSCRLTFRREAGFYLGSIYVNYGLTALIVSVAYPILMFNEVVSDRILMPASLTFVLVFPVWFFRYARSLWLGFDQYVDPSE